MCSPPAVAPCLNEVEGSDCIQDCLEEPLLRPVVEEPGAELAEDRVMEASRGRRARYFQSIGDRLRSGS